MHGDALSIEPLSTPAFGGKRDDRREHRVLPLPGRRREGNPSTDPSAIELAKPSYPLAAAELVHLGGDGRYADRARPREVDEHSLLLFGGATHVEQQNEAAKQRPFGEIALDRSGEAPTVALGRVRESVAGKVHEGEARVRVGEEMDPPRAAGGLAHPREIAPSGDAVQ